MKKIFAVLLVATCISLNIKAQSYTQGLGARLIENSWGDGSYRGAAFTYKKFFKPGTAIDLFATGGARTWGTGSSVSAGAVALFEPHKHFFTGLTNGLSWYWGVGPAIGITTVRQEIVGGTDQVTNYFGFGVRGGFGAEFVLPSAPWAFSVDVQPGVDLNFGGDAISTDYVHYHTISAKYLLDWSSEN